MKKFYLRIKKIFDQFGWLKLVVLIVLFLSMLLIVKFFGRTGREAIVRVEVLPDRWQYGAQNVSIWMAQKVKQGHQEFNPAGEATAEIIDADIYDQGDEKKKVYLVLKLKGLQDDKTDIFKYKGYSVQTNKVLHFDFPDYQFDAKVLDIGDSAFTKKENLLITAKWSEVEKKLINDLEPGLSAYNRADKEKIAELINFQADFTKSQIFIDQGRSLSLTADPDKRDVLLELKLVVEKVGQDYLYAGHQKVKAGEFLWIYTEKLDLEKVQILAIEPVNND